VNAGAKFFAQQNEGVHMNIHKPEVLAVSIDDALAMLGVRSRVTLYKMMKDGRLKALKVGRRRLVTVESIRALISEAA
jgi:excisionase family DNA binding protein